MAARTLLAKKCLARTLTRRLRVWRVHSKRFGKCLRVWRVRAKRFGKCQRVWQVSQVRDAQKIYFICMKQSSLHLPNLQDLPNSTNLPNLHNTCQTCLCEYPIFIILANLVSREYQFLTYSSNSTCMSTGDICQTCTRKIHTRVACLLYSHNLNLSEWYTNRRKRQKMDWWTANRWLDR